MKLLFFPSDLGGGFGHISRCLAFAHEAARRKHHCAFVMNARKFESLINADFTTFVSQRSLASSFMRSLFKRFLGQLYSRKSPLFTEISDLDYQVIRDGLINAGHVKKKIAHYLHIVNTFQPDLLIGDTNLLVWIISQITHIPVVQIVRYASHPQTAHLLWWKNRPDGLVPPDSSALFNPLLNAMGLPSIKRATDLLQGDGYIVPSLPEIEPIPDDGKTLFVGALTRSNDNNAIPSWLQECDPRRPLVYITLGGGAGPVGNELFFATILEAFADPSLHVVVSTSCKFDPSNLPFVPPHIKFFQWVPGQLLIARADMTIFHGGYGTMMETIASGKPSIIIPFQSEQEGNGRRLEQLGSSRVLKVSEEPYHRIDAQWEYGAYSFLIQQRYDLTPQELYTAVEAILHSPEYRKHAEDLQTKNRNHHGAQQAVDFIEHSWARL